MSMRKKLWALVKKIFDKELTQWVIECSFIRTSELNGELRQKDKKIEIIDRWYNEVSRERDELKQSASMANLVRHAIATVKPGDTIYEESDIKSSEDAFLNDCNAVAQNSAFQLVIGRLGEEVGDETLTSPYKMQDLERMQMTKSERISYGQGKLDGIALVKEEVETLAIKSKNRATERKITPEETHSLI